MKVEGGNLPARLKMTPPRYQDIVAKDIPAVTDDDGASTSATGTRTIKVRRSDADLRSIQATVPLASRCARSVRSFTITRSWSA